MTVRTVDARDDESEAHAEAGRRNATASANEQYGVMRTVDWNCAHPEAPARTASRWVIFRESRDG